MDKIILFLEKERLKYKEQENGLLEELGKCSDRDELVEIRSKINNLYSHNIIPIEAAIEFLKSNTTGGFNYFVDMGKSNVFYKYPNDFKGVTMEISVQEAKLLNTMLGYDFLRQQISSQCRYKKNEQPKVIKPNIPISETKGPLEIPLYEIIGARIKFDELRRCRRNLQLHRSIINFISPLENKISDSISNLDLFNRNKDDYPKYKINAYTYEYEEVCALVDMYEVIINNLSSKK
jgi:hypothetical protein